jgi:hypothetical protein
VSLFSNFAEIAHLKYARQASQAGGDCHRAKEWAKPLVDLLQRVNNENVALHEIIEGETSDERSTGTLKSQYPQFAANDRAVCQMRFAIRRQAKFSDAFVRRNRD